jgi:signal peptidase I
MNIVKYKLLLLVVAVFGTTLSLMVSTPAAAVDLADLTTQTNCKDKSKVKYTASLFQVPEGQYDVYVKLAKRGQLANVNVAGQINDETAACHKVGRVDVSGDRWTKAGVWDQTFDTHTTFQVSSNVLGSSIDANRPSVMLVPRENPLCVPRIQCEVSLANESGYVLPPGSLATSDSLRLVRVVDPSTDQIKKVVYYVDDEPVYTASTLEPFDTKYVVHREQKLERVVEYASGQRIVVGASLPEGFSDNFGNFLFRIFHTNPTLSWTVVIAGLLAILIGVVYAIIRSVHRRHEWRLAHGFITEEYVLLSSTEQLQLQKRVKLLSIIRQSLGYTAGAIGILVTIVLVNTFAIGVSTVDGQSMQSTYFTGNQLLVNKLPVTWAHSRSVQAIPERGQVVILRPVYGIVDPQIAEFEQSNIVKRVIGLPGERVVIKDGKITIYNEQYPKGFDPDQGQEWVATYHPNDPSENLDLTLESDELFISGDNRPESIDSRFNGPISTRQLIGIVVVKLW